MMPYTLSPTADYREIDVAKMLCVVRKGGVVEVCVLSADGLYQGWYTDSCRWNLSDILDYVTVNLDRLPEAFENFPSEISSWTPSDQVARFSGLSEDGEKALSSFAVHLDKQVFSVGSAGRFEPEEYNRLVTDPLLKRSVVDLYQKHAWFLNTCPVHLLLFVFDESKDPGFLNRNPDAVVLEIINSGLLKEYHDPDPERWPISATAIKSMAKFARQDMRCDLRTLAFISSFPSSWHPTLIKGDWVSLSGASRLVGRSVASKPSDLVDLFEGFKGDLRRAERAMLLHEDLDPQMHYDEINDFATAFVEQIIHPLFEFAGGNINDPTYIEAMTDISKNLLGCRSIQKFSDLSERWHNQFDFAEVIAKFGPDVKWKPLTKEITSGDRSLRLQFLTTPYELLDEGSKTADRNGSLGLDHCVASKVIGCLTGDTHIGSIRRFGKDGSYERLSTFEYSTDSGIYELVQHRGRKNVDPPKVAVQMLDHWKRLIDDGVIDMDWDAICPPTNEMRVDKATFDEVLLPWRSFLKRSLQAYSQRELAQYVMEAFDTYKMTLEQSHDDGYENSAGFAR